MNPFSIASRSLLAFETRILRICCARITAALNPSVTRDTSTKYSGRRRYSTISSNTAAYITAAKARPLEVRSAPLGEPSEDQILIRNHALAINPIDFKLQSLAIYPIEYPSILGQDVAGEIVSVGSNVSRFKPGDRVIGCTAGFSTKKDTEKGFQQYTVLEKNLSTHIPDDLPFDKAVVLPLAITTASAGLFQSDFLNLQQPTEPAQNSTGQVVLVWGGASSVGSAAIQLAVAAGYEVFTTASAKNFKQVKRLGPSQIFDYNSSDVVEKVLEALNGKTLAGGYDAVGRAAWAPTVEVVQKSEGNKVVATAVRGFPDPPEGITMKACYSLSIMNNHVGNAVWEDFLSKALTAGTFVAFPEPLIIGNGLESVQIGIDVIGKGVSAQKVVVTL